MKKLTITEAAKIKGVSASTLRRWEAEGKLIPERTANGHRRYDLAHLLGLKPNGALTIAYARVSSHDQKDDLDRQKQVLELFCASHGWQFQIIDDVGSGVNYSKRGLQHLIRAIADNQVERLVLTHKDRLLRFGCELIFNLCEHFGTEVVIINQTENATCDEDLGKDILEIITVVSARLDGSRNPKNKRILEELKAIGDKL
ncbi:IS607 family transposase [Microcoleus vaginatus PCC 9802]|uniref:IS607 family transposase n=1 Tax=Microcoleus vaginatus TaxID=119532 RepID=UPI00020D3009|nr:Resolvase domain-containing protein [Microcoleus vaginatus FGP-2]UNU19717.1 IS607 family transposase [Microcoleus vaginatus PCC 9802]